MINPGQAANSRVGLRQRQSPSGAFFRSRLRMASAPHTDRSRSSAVREPRLVIVGSDGTETSLYAVNRAHAVPAEADSHVLVVSAYDPGPAPSDLQRGNHDLALAVGGG